MNLSKEPYYIKPSKDVQFKSLKLRKYNKYVCKLCDKEFNQSGHLDTHIRLKHSLDKPYHCVHPGCNKSFAVRWALRTHMKNHEEKKHSCNYCEKKYHQKFQLMTHIRFKHLGMSYDCNVCGKKFESVYLLNYHLDKHTE